MPDILSIAIPTFGREGVLLDTLDQVLAAKPADAEVLVVDQTADHEVATLQRLQTWVDAGDIRWIQQQPPSLTSARNRALREARGGIVLFLDDDVRVPPSLFAEHLRLYRDSSVAAVTGQVWNCRDPENPPFIENPTQGTYPHSHVAEQVDARNISGGNHSVRRSVALAIGGYDPAFRGSALGEDMDFSQRLLLAGHRIIYNPDAWIIHLGIRSGGCAVGAGSPWPEWQHAGSLLLYAFRHGRRQKNTSHIVWMALRNGPLRREVATNPIKWPGAWCGFLRGVAYGWRHRRFQHGIESGAAYG
ncbi:MAG: glycosyltransferase family 2 protein [Kiritimatiellae bacterium]|nr:glycosyltransferase family 2 protein [Kiritimatiellia bacterium]